MKFEENWPRGFKGEVVQRCERTDDDGRQVITIAHPEPCSGELKTLSNCRLLNMKAKALFDRQSSLKWTEQRCGRNRIRIIFTTLWTNSADDKTMMFLLFSPRK